MRLFTTPLLHGGPAHLVGNLVALGLGDATAVVEHLNVCVVDPLHLLATF